MFYNPLFGTHLPLLIRIMSISHGNVLELGMGLSSTPFLHWMCFDQDRPLLSFENDLEFYKMLRPYNHPKFHKVRYIDDWNKLTVHKQRWSVVLIDTNPKSSRREFATKLKETADFVILHDTENSHERLYRYRDPIIGCFKDYKFSYTYKKTSPNTTVLSNVFDVSKII